MHTGRTFRRIRAPVDAAPICGLNSNPEVLPYTGLACTELKSTFMTLQSISPFTIRDAVPGDVPALSRLMTELGYPTTPEQMEMRFQQIRNERNYRTFVAECGGVVVGMAGACLGYYYEHDGMYVRLVAMVTGQLFRGRGVGKELLKAVEAWGRESGVSSLVLNSGNRKERQGAHAFYVRNGFEARSTGFIKKLNR